MKVSGCLWLRPHLEHVYSKDKISTSKTSRDIQAFSVTWHLCVCVTGTPKWLRTGSSFHHKTKPQPPLGRLSQLTTRHPGLLPSALHFSCRLIASWSVRHHTALLQQHHFNLLMAPCASRFVDDGTMQLMPGACSWHHTANYWLIMDSSCQCGSSVDARKAVFCCFCCCYCFLQVYSCKAHVSDITSCLISACHMSCLILV